MVGQRRGLLAYLRKVDIERYRILIERLGLRKQSVFEKKRISYRIQCYLPYDSRRIFFFVSDVMLASLAGECYNKMDCRKTLSETAEKHIYGKCIFQLFRRLP